MTLLCKNTYLLSLEKLKKKSPLLKTLLLLKGAPSFSNALDFPSNPKALFEILEKKEVMTLFIYGALSPTFCEKIMLWLDEKKERRLVFFEDDIELIQLSLAHPKTHKLLFDARVSLHYLKAPKFWQQNEKNLKAHLNLPFEITAQKKESARHKKSFLELKNKLISRSMDQNAIFSEYLFSSSLFYDNLLHNLIGLEKASLTPHFFNLFSNKPAIICGAGPSMNHQAPFLKKWQQKGLIFAGGRALSVLNSFQIEPHFSLGIDPYPMHEMTYSQNNFFELPLIYRARMHKDAVQKAHGEKVYTPKGIGYPLVEWIESQFKIKAPLILEGMNVVNFSLTLAEAFGCNPIILVGCDLAYTHQNPYSSECVLNQSLPDNGTLDHSDYSIHRGVYKKNGLNKQVYTLWKWAEEASWMGSFAKAHPKTQFINTLKEGLKIPHFQLLSLKECETTFLKKTYDFQGMIHTELLNSQKKWIETKKLETLYGKIQKSLMRAQQILSKQTKNYSEYLNQKLISEIAYQKMLLMLDELFLRVEIEKDPIKKELKRALFLLSICNQYLDVFNLFLDENVKEIR